MRDERAPSIGQPVIRELSRTLVVLLHAGGYAPTAAMTEFCASSPTRPT